MCILLDYIPGQKAYKAYDINTHQTYTSGDIIFYETHFRFSRIPAESDFCPLPLGDLTNDSHIPSNNASSVITHVHNSFTDYENDLLLNYIQWNTVINRIFN